MVSRQPPTITFDGTTRVIGYHHDVTSERPDDRLTYERAPHPRQKDATFYAEHITVYLESPECWSGDRWRIDEVNITGPRWDDSHASVMHSPAPDGTWPDWVPSWARQLADDLLALKNAKSSR